MAINISRELEEAMFGDEAILKYLEICRTCFVEGDRTALFGAIVLCARYQAVIPEWATDEILAIERTVKTGATKDFNIAFGWSGEHMASRKKRDRLKKLSPQVLSALLSHRLKGASLNADDALDSVAKELKISRRDVEEIYKLSGKFIKGLPRENPNEVTHGIVSCEISLPRRTGRPVLQDK